MQTNSKRLFVSNAFSLNMVSPDFAEKAFDIMCDPLTPEIAGREIREAGDSLVCSMGNKITVELANTLCNTEMPVDHTKIELLPGDAMIVFQYNGPKLIPGKPAPEGGSFRIFMLQLAEADEEAGSL
tara:strand:+ start:443 stop:823 length:381 start_codon:yes stop_codon:yes gene_type:complete